MPGTGSLSAIQRRKSVRQSWTSCAGIQKPVPRTNSGISCSCKQPLERRNKPFTLKQEFGNRPVWPTTQNAEAKTVPTLDGSRTFVSTGYWREGLIKFQISNGPPSFYVLLYILRSLCYCQLIISNQAFPIVMDAYVVYARRNSCGIMANEQNIGAKEERDVI